jgi:PPOX class probable F420-dependent enzyme
MELPDETTPFGRRVRERLRDDTVIWLTTTAADGTPQPNPVWFVWEEPASVIVYNRAEARRLEHVALRPRVALHFDGNGRGGDIVVLTGVAEQAGDLPGPHQHRGYAAKYADAMAGVSGSAEGFAEDYPVPLRVRINRVRGH